MTDDSPPEDPPLEWEGRVCCVAIAWALPGILIGAFAYLLLPPQFLVECLIGGGSLGALAGGLLEAGYFD